MTSPSTGSTFANVRLPRRVIEGHDSRGVLVEHPEPNTREEEAETAALANADYGYAADISTPFTQPNPTTRLHKSSH